MERRNFFKSLFAAGMVVAAPRILTDNVEALPISKSESIPITKAIGGIIKHSDIPACKGRIVHKGNTIANFDEVEITANRDILDISYYFPTAMEYTLIIHAININYELSGAALVSDDSVNIIILTENADLIEAEAYIQEMQINTKIGQPFYSKWTLKIIGAVTIEPKA